MSFFWTSDAPYKTSLIDLLLTNTTLWGDMTINRGALFHHQFLIQLFVSDNSNITENMSVVWIVKEGTNTKHCPPFSVKYCKKRSNRNVRWRNCPSWVQSRVLSANTSNSSESPSIKKTSASTKSVRMLENLQETIIDSIGKNNKNNKNNNNLEC